MRFQRMRRAALHFAALGVMAAVAGCNSTADDPVFSRQAAANTGTFPNLNQKAPVATTQFTPYSLSQHNATIATAQQGQQTEGAVAANAVAQSAADQVRLQQLRDTHAQATVAAIEGK